MNYMYFIYRTKIYLFSLIFVPSYMFLFNPSQLYNLGFGVLSDQHLVLFRSVILLPIAITFCVTWWFISFVDGFFSPIYAHLGINVFGWCIVFSYLLHTFVILHIFQKKKKKEKKLYDELISRSWICDFYHFYIPDWCVHVAVVGSFCS